MCVSVITLRCDDQSFESSQRTKQQIWMMLHADINYLQYPQTWDTTTLLLLLLIIIVHNNNDKRNFNQQQNIFSSYEWCYINTSFTKGHINIWYIYKSEIRAYIMQKSFYVASLAGFTLIKASALHLIVPSRTRVCSFKFSPPLHTSDVPCEIHKKDDILKDFIWLSVQERTLPSHKLINILPKHIKVSRLTCILILTYWHHCPLKSFLVYG